MKQTHRTMKLGLCLAIGFLALTGGSVEAQHAPFLVFAEDAPGSMQVAHDDDLNPGSAFTVEMWVYLVTFDNCQSMFGKNWRQAYWLGICNGSIRTYTHGTGTQSTSEFVVPLRQWFHLAATFESGSVKHFFNGQMVAEFDAPEEPVPATDDPLGVGWDSEWEIPPFGAVDEVRLWNVARSEADIAATMDAPIGDPVAGLVASWNFDEDAWDSVGGHHGTLDGIATIRTEVPQSDGCFEEYFVPAVAHAAGVGDSQWRTDFYMRNGDAVNPAAVTLELMPRNQDNTVRPAVSDGISGGRVLAIRDIVLDVFDEDSMAAAMRVCSTEPLHISTRTFNQSDEGTFGQAIPGLPASAGIASGSEGWIIGLEESDAFRTNLGFTNTSDVESTVEVTFFSSNGADLGTKEYSIPPYGHRQISSPFADVSADPVTNGSVAVSVSGSTTIVYASVVDNATDDGTFFLAE
jgi:hypothetical protein